MATNRSSVIPQGNAALLVLLYYLAPLLTHRYLGASSFSTGLILVAVVHISLLTCFQANFSRSVFFFWFAATFGLLVHSSFALTHVSYTNVTITIASAILLPLIFISVRWIIKRVEVQDFYLVFFILLFSQAISTPFHIMGWFARRSSLLFNEPSHFALFILPLALIYFYTSRSKPGAIIAIALYLLSLISYYGSLTVIVFMLAMTALGLQHGKLATTSSIAASFATGFLFYSINYDYIQARMDFLSETNASVLTFRAAYSRMWDIWNDGYWWGVGLQNFGQHPVNSAAFDILFEIDGRVSLNDGAVTFAKLGSEFGIFSLLLPIMLLVYFVRTAFVQIPGSKLGIPFAIALLIELFFRGTGYFSPTFIFGFCLLLFGLFSCDVSQNKIRGGG